MGGTFTKIADGYFNNNQASQIVSLPVDEMEDCQLTLLRNKKDSDSEPILDLKEEETDEDQDMSLSAENLVEVIIKVEDSSEFGQEEENFCMSPQFNLTAQVDPVSHRGSKALERKEPEGHSFEDYTKRSNIKVISRANIPVLVCRLCRKEYKTMATFRKHLVYHSSQGNPFPCEVCAKNFRNEGELKSHFLSHKYAHKCCLCTETFSSKKNMAKHRKSHFQYQPSEFYGQEATLKPQENHLRSPKSEDTKIIRGENSESPGKPSEEESKDQDLHFQCKKCNRLFSEKPLWTEHVKNHALCDSMDLCLIRTEIPVSAVKSTEDFDFGCFEDASKARFKGRESEDYQCHGNGEKFSDEEVEHQETRFHCKTCDTAFSDKCVWSEHIKNHALNDSPKVYLDRTGIPVSAIKPTEDLLDVGVSEDTSKVRREHRSEEYPASFNEQEHLKVELIGKRCDRQFSGKSVWMEHTQNHLRNEVMQLAFCSDESAEKDTVPKIGESVRGLHYRYHCVNCKRRISENVWTTHLKYHALADKALICQCLFLARRHTR